MIVERISDNNMSGGAKVGQPGSGQSWAEWKASEDERILTLRAIRKEDDKIGSWLLLPCWDDDDKGVPPGCGSKFCPLSQDNYILNNAVTWRHLGPIGFEHYDRRRKLYLGYASVLTVFTMLLTLWGCFALSTETRIVQRTYWAAGSGSLTNTTTGHVTPFAVYVGLNSFVYTECQFIPGYMNYGNDCQLHPINFNNINHEAATAKVVEYKAVSCGASPLPQSFCEACQSATGAIWFSAVTNCAGLILALLGAQTRMRLVADIPVQKLLGMGADTVGVFSLIVALAQFEHSCLNNLKSAILDSHITAGKAWLGPGFACYIACVFCGFTRAFLHYITPLPGMARPNATSCFKGVCGCCVNDDESLLARSHNAHSINGDVSPTNGDSNSPSDSTRGGDKLL